MTKPAWIAVVALLMAALALGVSQAQDRQARRPVSEQRYQLREYSATDSVVFDTYTGRIIATEDLKTIRVVDPVAGVVITREMDEDDRRGGGVIRQR